MSTTRPIYKSIYKPIFGKLTSAQMQALIDRQKMIDAIINAQKKPISVPKPITVQDIINGKGRKRRRRRIRRKIII